MCPTPRRKCERREDACDSKNDVDGRVRGMQGALVRISDASQLFLLACVLSGHTERSQEKAEEA